MNGGTLSWYAASSNSGIKTTINKIKNKTKQNKTKQNKTKQNKTKQNKTKQNYFVIYYLVGDYQQVNTEWQVAGMQQMITTVRNTGATNVVLVGIFYYFNF
jgi:hypothetical protein